MGDITNKVVDELILRGAEKYERGMNRVISTQEKLARAQKRARKPFGDDEGWRDEFRRWDRQMSLGSDMRRRLALDKTQEIKRTGGRRGEGGSAFGRAAGAGLGLRGAGSIFGASASAGAAAAGALVVYGLTKLAQASLAAAGATERHKNTYDSATKRLDTSTRRLNEAIGSRLMPSFDIFSRSLEGAADGLAYWIDAEAFKRSVEADDRTTPLLKEWRKLQSEGLTPSQAALKMGLGDRTSPGQARADRKAQIEKREMRTTVPNAPSITLSEDRVATGKLIEARRRAIKEEAEERRQAIMEERSFRQRLYKEQIEEMHRERQPSFKDLQKYVVGGGSHAGIGITPVELGMAGQSMGGSRSPIKVKFEGGASEMEQALGAAMARYFEMFLGQAIRQGQVQPGSGR